MSTKVKGEAIKEGSIPLSALNDEVKNKIENAGSGADWNAREDEPGYIKNRTHYLYGKSSRTLGKGVNRIDYEGCTIILIDGEIKRIPEFEDNLEIQIISGPPIYIKYTIINNKRFIELIDNFNYFATKTITFFNYNKTINDIYLPDTVLKTTPQTLSDNDKNQALANLGIDPVVWKYICNPVIIKQGEKVPEELIGEFNEEEGGYNIKYPYKNMYVVDIDGYSINPIRANNIGISVEGFIGEDMDSIRCAYGSAWINENKKWSIDA